MTPLSQAPQNDTADGAHAPPGFLGWVSALVHAHRGPLLRYATRRGLSPADALDCVQDAFVSFLGLPSARTIAEAPGDAIKMLTVVVRHDVMNRRRKRTRRDAGDASLAIAAQEPFESSEELVARAEELARVHGCILRMAELQRRVIMLSLLDEQPREHVAATLGISDGYVRVLLHRAREHVRGCTFEYDDEKEEG